jgi:glycosyltransferase involved in cell wall biosynthesis
MTLWHLRTARALGRAFTRRDRERPFDLVQSCDHGMAGLFVRARTGRPHLVRCSGATDLYEESGGNKTFDSALTSAFERFCVRRADAAYAPSQFLARYYGENYGLRVTVLHPPLLSDTEPAASPPDGLPGRYLVYFGLVGRRKGTDVLAAALPIAWQAEPSLAMVWAGQEAHQGELDAYYRLWGPQASQVNWLGFLPKRDLYAVVRHADASVIPSRVDNLPNSAIESVLLGTPIIGSQGASLDEVVEPGRSGLLVPIGDPHALAEALIRVWRRDVPWNTRGWVAPGILEEMRPAVAVAGLLRLAGYASEAQEAARQQGEN